MSKERLGNVLSKTNDEHQVNAGAVRIEVDATPGGETGDPDAEAEAFIRFCYRRRAVKWPELYDEMCAVAAREAYHGMDYEQLQRLGIGFALASLPRLAELAARVIAQERDPNPIAAVA